MKFIRFILIYLFIGWALESWLGNGEEKTEIILLWPIVIFITIGLFIRQCIERRNK